MEKHKKIFEVWLKDNYNEFSEDTYINKKTGEIVFRHILIDFHNKYISH